MNTPILPAWWHKLLAAIATVLAVVGGTVLVIDTDGPGPGLAKTITIPRTLTKTVAVTPAATADPKKPDTTIVSPAEVPGKPETNLNKETLSPSNAAAQDKAAATDQLPTVAPDAAPYQRGCETRLIGANYSTRRGLAPHDIVLHETVSFDIKGWSDVNAIAGFFARPPTKASSNFVLDREGHCLYIVRVTDKAWAQMDFNGWAISFEIINPATLSPQAKNYIDGPGRKKLLGLINDLSKDWNIPLRRAVVRNCVPVRHGILDHESLGPCGGGHVDITPHRNAIDPIISDARKVCVRRYRAAHHAVPARCKA